eukprot:12407613-Karenia_brevis.AAC.1
MGGARGSPHHLVCNLESMHAGHGTPRANMALISRMKDNLDCARDTHCQDGMAQPGGQQGSAQSRDTQGQNGIAQPGVAHQH